VLYTLPALVFIFAGVVYTSRSSFRGSKCCIHFPLKFSSSQVLYTLPAQVFVVTSVVYTSRSSFRGSKCCIHLPLKFSWSQVLHTFPNRVFMVASVYILFPMAFSCSQVLYTLPSRMFVVVACARICLPSQVLYALPARVRRFVICSPFLFENDFFHRFRHLGPVCYCRSITPPLKPRRLTVIKRIPWNAGSGASSPCSFAHNDTFSSLFAVLELGGRSAVGFKSKQQWSLQWVVVNSAGNSFYSIRALQLYITVLSRKRNCLPCLPLSSPNKVQCILHKVLWVLKLCQGKTQQYLLQICHFKTLALINSRHHPQHILLGCHWSYQHILIEPLVVSAYTNRDLTLFSR